MEWGETGVGPCGVRGKGGEGLLMCAFARPGLRQGSAREQGWNREEPGRRVCATQVVFIPFEQDSAATLCAALSARLNFVM